MWPKSSSSGGVTSFRFFVFIMIPVSLKRTAFLRRFYMGMEWSRNGWVSGNGCDIGYLVLHWALLESIKLNHLTVSISKIKISPSRFHSACFDPDYAYGGVGIGILVQRNSYEPITSWGFGSADVFPKRGATFAPSSQSLGDTVTVQSRLRHWLH